jgi:hypothetical protein
MVKAGAQFKHRVKPTDGPANIVPQTFLQYQIHKKEMEAEHMLTKFAALEAKKDCKGLAAIRTAFDGKLFKSDRFSVLSQSTIWSGNFKPTYDHPHIEWPRENSGSGHGNALGGANMQEHVADGFERRGTPFCGTSTYSCPRRHR